MKHGQKTEQAKTPKESDEKLQNITRRNTNVETFYQWLQKQTK